MLKGLPQGNASEREREPDLPSRETLLKGVPVTLKGRVTGELEEPPWEGDFLAAA
jgi:hypothetical protein